MSAFIISGFELENFSPTRAGGRTKKLTHIVKEMTEQCISRRSHGEIHKSPQGNGRTRGISRQKEPHLKIVQD